MSDMFGKRTIFSPPFVVPDVTVPAIEAEPVFEAPWGTGPRPNDETNRNIVFGSAMVSGIDPDVFS